MRLCLYLNVICMLYNKIHTDEQISVLCGTVEKNRVEKYILLEIFVSKATIVVLLGALKI